jgi:type I restriction enzyme S subunit
MIDRQAVSPDEITSGTTYVGLENITGEGAFVDVGTVNAGELASGKFRFSGEHILYGKLRPYLRKIARPQFNGVCSTDILPIRPGSSVDRDYLAHFLRLDTSISFANSRTTGANLPRISPSALESIELPLPPIGEQRRIAAILDQAEALRTMRHQARAKLDTLSQSLFLEMFGEIVSKPGTIRLDQLVEPGDSICYGVVQPGDDYEGGVPLVRSGDFQSGRLSNGGLKTIDPLIEASYRRSRLRGYELLVSCVGSIGSVALVDCGAKGFNIARAVARIPFDVSKVRGLFLLNYLRTAQMQRYFTAETRTVAQPTLNIKQLSEATINLPHIAEQDRFVRPALAIRKCIESSEMAMTRTDALFASLQHRAFGGEL